MRYNSRMRGFLIHGVDINRIDLHARNDFLFVTVRGVWPCFIDCCFRDLNSEFVWYGKQSILFKKITNSWIFHCLKSVCFEFFTVSCTWPRTVDKLETGRFEKRVAFIFLHVRFFRERVNTPLLRRGGSILIILFELSRSESVCLKNLSMMDFDLSCVT